MGSGRTGGHVPRGTGGTATNSWVLGTKCLSSVPGRLLKAAAATREAEEVEEEMNVKVKKKGNFTAHGIREATDRRRRGRCSQIDRSLPFEDMIYEGPQRLPRADYLWLPSDGRRLPRHFPRM
ncbi:hypothetical protein E2C01_099693 [Portunus trituberculatus]|uniref:Uncharacterized protein n=1 Tax=Portunus trituberculatus TaxID=210409 RepID=A0A5B7KHH3_PORTR|nr:hypothetical protein [Portunus trituberculatus]